MMAVLFLVYLICLLLIMWGKQNFAFALLLINFALTFLVFLTHSTEILHLGF